ncbi:unnamed protein product [Meloidogyne enterolobii]|uniref:Uncharacterized protein n=1 Tax=Meloidogyne enterolobii TaxID=390850 RepID=A0ACB1A2N0_MELEN
MIKFLILICLIIKTHSWTWDDYPSPRGQDYWKCGVSHPTYVCDPDGMLTDQEREEIVHMVEDFKEKTKRPNSIHQCMRKGLRLVVALAKVKIGPSNDSTVDFTELCANNTRRWTSIDSTKCESNVQGIEVNLDGFSYCRWIHLFMALHKDEYEQLQRTGTHYYKTNYFDALKDYIINLRMLYINRYSIFYNPDVSNEDKCPQQPSNNLSGIASIIFCVIISLVLVVLFYRIHQLENYFDKSKASQTEMKLIMPMHS